MTASRRSPLNSVVAAVLGLAGGVLLFLDPFQWHALDERLRGDGHASPMHGPQPSPTAEGEILFYRNPMDPTITSPVPAKDEMGMDYVPVRAEDLADGDAPGAATVRIDPSVAQNMNVRTEPVARREVGRRIRSVGNLEFDPERVVTVTTKYPGWVEKVYANYVGEPVRKGQPLFEIYAPELVQTQQELLSALAHAEHLADAPAASHERAEALAEAARTRLGLWDIDPDQVRALEATGEVLRTLQVVAPASGVIMMRQPGLEGMAVQPGMELFRIADLSVLWVSVELFEEQLAWIREGTPADVTLSYFPGRTLTGTVRFIEPEVSETTRTLGVKIAVPNPDRSLRPGMFASVALRPRTAEARVAAPSAAVIRSGRRNVVLVEVEPGAFTPREIILGYESDGWVEVIEGLAEGEVVVTSAQFLLDSEASLQEAIRRMIRAPETAAGDVPSADEAAPPSNHDHH